MRLIIFAAFFLAISCIKMRLTLDAQQTRCFYQMLMAHQKYAVEVSPLQEGKYELSIKHQMSQGWQHSVHRNISKPFQNITLFKLAKHETLYSFCLTNNEVLTLSLRVDIRWGLELLDLRAVAEESDQQRIQREAKWIQKQADKIQQVVKGTFVKRRDREEYANLMRKKLIGYGLIGMLALVVISVFFYYNLRKTFHERKLI